LIPQKPASGLRS